MVLSRFDSPADMEPLLPSGEMSELISQATLLIKSAAELGGYFPPETRQAGADLVRSMNGYYSNLIEGHRTRPGDRLL
jgi:hypothetical protein